MPHIFLEPGLQRLHARLVPGEIPFLLVLRQLVAYIAVYGGVQDSRVLIPIEAVAELPDGAGVYERPIEPVGRQFCELWVHDGRSFRLS